jgi:hypothetical protein
MSNELDSIRAEIVDHAMGPNPRVKILDRWLDAFEAAVRSERTPSPPVDLSGELSEMTPDQVRELQRISAAAPSCTGCGAQITETKHGRATLHVAGCRYVGERGPQV